MDPLVAIAVGLVPELGGLVSGANAQPLIDAVKKIVSDAAGPDPVAAKLAIDANPTLGEQVRTQLVALIADAGKTDASTTAPGPDPQGLPLEEAHRKLAEQLSALQAQMDRLVLPSPRGSAKQARSGRRPPWGASVISTVVTLGFFGILLILIYKPGDAMRNDTNIFQLVNLTVGAMISAFTTVVSFWVGSSLGSRNKDDALIEGQVQPSPANPAAQPPAK